MRGDADESPQEEVERQLGELLQELRVAMPGVQLLFAFLLVVPFNQRFDEVTSSQRGVYLGALICAAFAGICFIAPTAYHRILFHARERAYLVAISQRMAIAGLVFLAAAMTGSVLLITSFLFRDATTAIVTAVVGLAFALVWFVLPLSRRLRRRLTH